MLLAIDVGNSRIKAAVFEDNAVVENIFFNKDGQREHLEFFFKKYPEIKVSMLSSVGNQDRELLDLVSQHSRLIEITHSSLFPYHNKYATPATLGIDRMVLAAGAVLQFPGLNRLVIDAGTCITYDFIDKENNYMGGAISPGLRLRYESLHNFTAKLPLLSPEMPPHYIGQSTGESIHSGVVNGVLNEIEGFISQYVEQYQELKIILTGGDADFLAKRFKNTIFANSNFLLESLSYLYTYSNQK